MESLVIVHKWQDRGLGKAPFRCVGMFSMPCNDFAGSNPSAYNAAMAEAQHAARQFGVSMGSCDVCGTGIHNHFVISDAVGKKFVVGCDCVAKTGDSKLMSAVKNEERLRLQRIRREKQAKANEESHQRWLATLAEQRQRNGGLTDAEVVQRDLDAKKELERAKFAVENEWILSVLKKQPVSDFVEAMIEKLETMPISHLSDRMVSVIGDIYCRSFGRKNSKAWNAAADEFIVRADIKD